MSRRISVNRDKQRRFPLKYNWYKANSFSVLLFPKILDATNFTMEIIFLIPLSITFLNPKILGFFFSSKNSLTLGAKCEKLNFRRSQGIHYMSFENCTSMEQSSRNFQPSSSKENSTQNLLLRAAILQKTVFGCP